MKMQICSIYDSVAKCFSQPIFLANTAMATRHFAAWASDPQSYISKSPADYTLYHIGEFDDENASLVPILPTAVIRADQTLKGNQT